MLIIDKKDLDGIPPLGTGHEEVKGDPPPTKQQPQVPLKSNRMQNYSIVREEARKRYGRTALNTASKAYQMSDQK